MSSDPAVHSPFHSPEKSALVSGRSCEKRRIAAVVESDDVESRVGYRHRFICLDDGLDRAVVEEMRHRKRRLASSKRRGLVRVVVIGDVATIDAVGGAD